MHLWWMVLLIFDGGVGDDKGETLPRRIPQMVSLNRKEFCASAFLRFGGFPVVFHSS